MPTMGIPVIPEKAVDMKSSGVKEAPAKGKPGIEGGFRKILKSSTSQAIPKASKLSSLATTKRVHRAHPPIESLVQGKTVKVKPKKLMHLQPQAGDLPATFVMSQSQARSGIKSSKAGEVRGTIAETPRLPSTPVRLVPDPQVPVKVAAPSAGPAPTQKADQIREIPRPSVATRTLIVSRRLSPVSVPKDRVAATNRTAATASAGQPLEDAAAIGKAASPSLIPVELAPPDNKLRDLTALKPIPTTVGTEPLAKSGTTGIQGWQVHPVSIRGQVGLQATRWKVSPPGQLRATIELGLSNSTKGWTVQISASHGDASWLTGAVANVSQLSQNFAKHGWNLSEVSLWNTSVGNPMGHNPSSSAFGQSGQGSGGQADGGFGSRIGPDLRTETETSRLSNSLQAVDYTA